MARYLRIAAAVVFALLALALVALWVRSHYWYDDIIYYARRREVEITSARGVLVCVTFPMPLRETLGAHWTSSPMNPWLALDRRRGFGFGLSIQPAFQAMKVPHWLLAASSLALAVLFAFKKSWRFTTRGLLIATTVVAGLLGLIAYSL
jgi:phosphotransferase system  glucose/maltose/N-acetylglucosamine-specific IIC component